MDNLTGAVVFFSCCRMTRPISSCTVEDADHPEAIGYIDMLIEALRNPREDSTVADGSDTNAKSSVEAFRQIAAVPEGAIDHHVKSASTGQQSTLRKVNNLTIYCCSHQPSVTLD